MSRTFFFCRGLQFFFFFHLLFVLCARIAGRCTALHVHSGKVTFSCGIDYSFLYLSCSKRTELLLRAFIPALRCGFGSASPFMFLGKCFPRFLCMRRWAHTSGNSLHSGKQTPTTKARHNDVFAPCVVLRSPLLSKSLYAPVG